MKSLVLSATCAGVVLCFALNAGLHTAAAAAPTDVRALEMMVSDNPRAAHKQAGLWLEEARAQQNRVKELQALRLSAHANEQMEELPQLKHDIAAGLQLARSLGDAEAIADFLVKSASLAARQNSFEEAARLFDEASAHIDSAKLPASLAKLQAAKGAMLSLSGRNAEGLALLIESHAYFESVTDPFWMSGTLSLMASAFGSDASDKAGTQKAIEYNLRALALMDEKHNRYDMATHFHNLGVDYASLGEKQKAREYFEKSLALSRELDDRVSIAYLDFRLGQLDRDDKRFPAALMRFDRAAAVFQATENQVMLLRVSVARASTLAALNRKREALESLQSARELAQKIETPATDIVVSAEAMDIFTRFGDFESALKEARQLRDAEQRATRASNAQHLAELEARFDSRQKEVENALLRSREKESDARRLALVLALMLALFALGGLAYFFVRQTKRHKLYETLALRDDLTELPNRRNILEFARLQLHRRRESDQGFCLVLIDIDYFKAINDEFGHTRGDAVLTAFAKACQADLRANDRLGRFGGEEFMLVMLGSGEAQVPALFERLRAAVQRIEVEGVPANRKLTFSLGAAVRKSPADSVDDLIDRADRALYRAKESGRDRFEIG